MLPSCSTISCSNDSTSEGRARDRELRERLLEGYRGAVPDVLLPDLRYVLGHVGCLMVARVDGKSPAGYLSPDERDAARAVGSRLLLAPPDSLDSGTRPHREGRSA